MDNSMVPVSENAEGRTVRGDVGAQALATVSRTSGVMALAYMSEQDFEARLVALKQGQERVRRIQRELMVLDEDYGVIPGTKKPTLLKPGAEKLCNVYGLVPTYEDTWIEGDGETSPHLRVRMKCFLRRGDDTGPVVNTGVGAANSWERKHRYRGGQRACPGCGVEGSIRRSKFEDRQTGDKGWYCHDKAGGCGAQFTSDDPRITDQQAGQVENPDPYDVENTLFKMAKKRAYIDATLNATATSGLFTQDLEDLAGDTPGAPSSPTSAAPARAGSAAPSVPTARRAAPPTPARGAVPAAGEKWMGPCPRCGTKGFVYVSRKAPGWFCWKTKGGCGYEFTPEDAAIHLAAKEERSARGVPEPAADDPFGDRVDEREPGMDG